VSVKSRIFGTDQLFGRHRIFRVSKEPNIRLFGIPIVGRSLMKRGKGKTYAYTGPFNYLNIDRASQEM
jgi:hypothetical protein